MKNNKIYILLISVMIAVLGAISISINIYAKESMVYELDIKKGTKLGNIAINNNKLDLKIYESDKLVLDNKNNLKAIDDSKLSISTSVIDDITINVSNNNGIRINDEKINKEYCFYRVSKFDILKKSINFYTLIYTILLSIISYLCISNISHLILKIKKDNVLLSDILLFLISNFIIFLECVYLLLYISKILLMIIILIYICYLIYQIRDKIKDNIHYIFIILSTIIGLTYLFLIPPLNVPDEPKHFMKSYSMFDSRYSSDEGHAKLDSNLYNFINYYEYPSLNFDIEFNGKNYFNSFYKDKNEKLYDYSYTNTKHASIVPYLPSAIVIKVGKLINISPLYLLILGRTIDLFISITLIYLAIKIIPKFKKLIFVIALFPTFIQHASAINMDFLTNSVSILFISYIINLIYKKDKITTKNIVILFILGFILGFCKFGFFPITLLVLLLPNKKIEFKKVKPIIIKILLILFVILVSYLNNRTLGGASSNNSFYTISYVITHPIEIIKVYLNTIFDRLDTDIFKGNFDSFGLYTKYNRSLFTTILIIMYGIILLSNDNEKIKINERLTYLFISLMLICIPYTAMLLCWTKVGAASIDGLQPRYFLIADLLLFMGLSNNIIKLNVKNKNLLYSICIIFNLCISLFTILSGFY